MSTAAKRTINMVHHPLGDASNPQELQDYLDSIDADIAAFGNGTGTVDLANTGLKVRDTNASHTLTIKPNSDLTGNKTLSLVTGDADRSLTLTADLSIGGTAYVSGGTDVIVADGGSGRSSSTAYAVICGGTDSTAAHQSIASVGSSGQVLTSNGAGNLPTFQASPGGVTTIASGSLPAGATQNLTSIPATYAYLVLKLSGVSFDTATRDIRVSVSVDNGSNFDTTAGNYVGYAVSSVPALSNWATGSLAGGSNIAAAATLELELTIWNYQGGMHPLCNMRWNSGATEIRNTIHYIGSTSAIDALQVFISGSGNFDAGTYALFGIK